MPSTDELRFGLTLSVDCKATRAAMDELCQLMEHDIGVPVRPLLAPSPSALADALVLGQAHFAWLSPTLLLMLPKLATMVPLLSSVRQSAAFFHAVVFAATGSPVETLDNLDGARVAWVAPTSASGYLVPRLTLARRGIDVRTAFSREDFFGTHGAVAAAVFEGRAEIGATYAHFEQADATRRLLRTGYSDAIPEREATVLAVSGPIPADMIVAHPDVLPAARIALAGSLSRMPSDPVGRNALRAVIGADDFRAVSNEAMHELRALTEASAALD
jgi:phosphonate transport system substrate-binding protein